MSTPKNPLELVDRYLQAVRFWLPRAEQEDLTAELGEDLRSQIDEKEAEFGRPLDKTEVSEILKRCGAPMVVATRIGPPKYLVGPALYPIYTFVLKMVLFWILVPVFIFIIGPVNVANSGNWGTAVASTLFDLWSGLLVAAGIITMVFAILERTSAHAAIARKWDPLSLPPVRKPEQKTSAVKAACELAFNFFGLIWLLLLPQYPILILGPAKAFLTAGTIWSTFYLPVVLVAIVALLRSAITLARPQWVWFPSSSQLLQTVLSLIVLYFMLNAVTQTPHGEWYPFVALRDGMMSAQYIKVAAIVNASILISLFCSWLGLCIALIVHTWQLVRHVRKRVSPPQQPASVQAR
jgi:hypothetical protein